MKDERYFIVNITARKKDSTKKHIYDTLTNVGHYKIPYIPLKTNTLTNTSENNLIKFDSNNDTAAIQIALPQNVDHMAVFNMVKEVNNELDVTLVGQQEKNKLSFEANPEQYGLTHFILGEHKDLTE